jgi:gamma-glutamylcyclotransferase (GGCT)/AIG2-like uncharacterized protein YtfP
MFPEVWQTVVGRAFETIEGTAAGYSIFRVRDAVFPGITAAGVDGAVRGVVYLDVDAQSLATLDKFEDDFYERKTLSIECADGQRRAAHAYVVPAGSREVLTAEPWDAAAVVSSGGLDQFIRRFQGFTRIGRGEPR